MFTEAALVGIEPAAVLAILSAGGFFTTSLATGVWKWRQMMASPTHEAHPYVDIAHRASLLYAFAAMLLATFASLSAWSVAVDLAATAVCLFYFAVAIGTYVWHGVRQRTTNQFDRRTFISTWGTGLLAMGEVGGFLVLFAGVAVTLLG